MGSSQQFSLRWNNYLSHITGAFDSLRSDEDLVDVTLSCEGKRIRAHKMLLSACSTYFRDLFKENPCQHPVIIFRNVKFEDLVALIDFMYQGEVNVVQEQLASFLTTAELLAVQGLSEGSGKDSNSETREDDAPDSPALPPEPEVQMTSSAQSHKQQVPGTSGASVSSPVSFYSVDQRPESPPTAKRRKWSSSSTGSKSNSANGGVLKDSERECETERKRGSSQSSGGSNVEPIEIIPVVPNLKVEMPEYMEHDPDASSCSYSDSNHGVASVSGAQNSSRDGMTSIAHSIPSGSSAEGKLEPPDMYSTNSRDSTLPSASDSIPPSDLSQMLVKPGPSGGENQSQDSLQGDPGITAGKMWSWLPPTDYFPSQPEKKYDIKEPQYMCRVCGKAFRSQNSCYDHMAIHRGTSKCSICECVLSRKANMKRHMRFVHGVFDTA
ncbi:hypothetical protein R5R35_012821 [Gryllus longicercus]|uniref:Uncharacterized protein n=1 Tax=Gryllus longicercus TaxID=2509291 RepID=A0AAN9UZP8_9ORTH